MIIPYPRKSFKIDIETYKLLGEAVFYYDIDNIHDLKYKIELLVKDPKLIKDMEIKISHKKLSFLKSWNQRIVEEIKILENNTKKIFLDERQ